MTQLAKLMFNTTRDMTMNLLNANMAGTVKMMQAMGAVPAPPEPSCCSIQAPQPTSSPLDVLYPLYWMKLASGFLAHVEKALPPGTTAAALPVATSVLDSVPVQRSLPPAAPSAPATGWGPMP